MELGEIGQDLRAAFDAVERLRGEKNFSQAELARKAGLSEATYNKLVKNPARKPYRRTVSKLRSALTELVAEQGA